MEPFDLERALAGELVKLRNGWTACVRHNETELDVPYPLTGYLFTRDGQIFNASWDRSGRFSDHDNNSIIGMWTRTITIGGMVVPEPAREPPKWMQRYWLVSLTGSGNPIQVTWQDRSQDYDWLSRGLIQLTEEGWRLHREALIRASRGEV